jgi:hypothetical protein
MSSVASGATSPRSPLHAALSRADKDPYSPLDTEDLVLPVSAISQVRDDEADDDGDHDAQLLYGVPSHLTHYQRLDKDPYSPLDTEDLVLPVSAISQVRDDDDDDDDDDDGDDDDAQLSYAAPSHLMGLINKY